MLYPQTKRAQHRPGAIAVWVVLSLSVIIAILAINLDGGQALEERRHLQSITDAATLAAANQLYSQYWDHHGQDPQGTAAKSAVKSAVDAGADPTNVTVNIPPKGGDYAGLPGYVEVVVQSQTDARFGRLFTSKPLVVRCRAVACGQPMKIGLILMRSDGAGALTNRAPVLSVINMPVIVNSADAAAYRQESFGTALATRFDITGGYTNPGNALFLFNKIRTGMVPTLDPLAYLPIPSASNLLVESMAPRTISGILPTVLAPGIYRGGLRITGLATVLMLPGTYIMEGGGFVVDGLATVVGLNVFVYNTVGTFPTGPISVTTLGKVVLTAPLSGTYQGLSFFQNRSLTTPLTIRGVGLTTLTGLVYAVRAPVVLSGAAAVGLDILGGAYVVDSMLIEGIGAIQINLNLNPPRIPDIHLVD